MDVILLERVAKLGQMGETVRVKNGFARNFLLPRAWRSASSSPRATLTVTFTSTSGCSATPRLCRPSALADFAAAAFTAALSVTSTVST